MRGGIPKSAALKKLQGNAGHRRKAAPVVEQGTPAASEISKPEFFFPACWEPAEWLPEGAKRIWCEQLPIARRETKLQESGLIIFAAYCDALHRLQKYSWEIDAFGATYTTASGFERMRPQVEMRDRAVNEVRNYASELNLTPKSWIGSMGTFTVRELDMFINFGRVQPPPEEPGGSGSGVA
jgi:phage terminase small subunit